MTKSAEPGDDPFADVLAAAPRLRTLAASIGLQDALEPATRAVCRRLAGQPAGDPGLFGRVLFTIADRELRLLAGMCRGEPARALVTGLAWLEQVLRNFGARDDGATTDREAADEAARKAMREQLSALLQRRVPADFPLPPMPREGAPADPLTAAATLSRRLKLSQATQVAAHRVEALDELTALLGTLLPGFGWDYGPGDLQRSLLAGTRHLAELLQRLPVLRRIAEELGRVEAVERRTRRATGGGRESVAGVHVGGELADVLPCEWALLGAPETEDLFYQRLAEHRLFCLELQGALDETSSAEQHRGPAVACVDTSGSMQGAPEAVAKALILAVVRRLAPQRRAVQLLLFGGPGESTEIELRPGRAGLQGLLQFLAMGFRSGTDYDTPLRRAVDLLQTEAYGKADVLIVTDGLCRASSRMVGDVARAKAKAKARVLSVVIGSDPAGVEEFSDAVWLLRTDAPVDGGFDLVHWRRA